MKFGRYNILEELGSGGFGMVYKAQDEVLGRIIALKVLHPGLLVDKSFVSRFRNEARLAAQLEHPNLVPVHDLGQEDGRYYITMAYMAGGSLKDKLKEGALPEESLRLVFPQILSGLEVIHDNGIIHRDLKPANILFDQYGVARISDLGFAKALQSDASLSFSMSGGIVGTPAYMAPEVWRNKPASVQTDIYSLGCILYEMLTGEVLFQGTSPAEIMTMHVIDGPQFKQELPDALRELLDKCLAMDSNDRYQHVNSILADYSSYNEKLELPSKEDVGLSEKDQDFSTSALYQFKILKTERQSQEQNEEAFLPEEVQVDKPSIHNSNTEDATYRIEKITNKNIWTFGTKQLIYATIGTALHVVLLWVLRASLSFFDNAAPTFFVGFPHIVPMFFGIVFGPIIGFIVGFFGKIIVDMINGDGCWIWWNLGNGIIGLIPGLFSGIIHNYKETRSILLAEASVLLGGGIASGIAKLSYLWVAHKDLIGLYGFTDMNFVMAIGYTIWGLIVVPVLMIVYDRIIQQRCIVEANRVPQKETEDRLKHKTSFDSDVKTKVT